MIESDGSSWHPAKDVARALKDCVRRLYTQAYHSWSETPKSIYQVMFNGFKTMCTWESSYHLVITTTFDRRASAKLSRWIKKVRDSGERSVGPCFGGATGNFGELSLVHRIHSAHRRTSTQIAELPWQGYGCEDNGDYGGYDNSHDQEPNGNESYYFGGEYEENGKHSSYGKDEKEASCGSSYDDEGACVMRYGSHQGHLLEAKLKTFKGCKVPLGASPNDLGDGPRSPKVPECG
ncbi:hypothetical protein MTR67_023626 [Solanum verrucosum]|uniref:Uncharacterized protein n=1 Tax=Solanum verrucosum TaxID=315347 RepID=A0AAF0QVJ7_SOLVR|nr:hypothetical protein MTR67_023626 [Solanum verrucosum]